MKLFHRRSASASSGEKPPNIRPAARTSSTVSMPASAILPRVVSMRSEEHTSELQSLMRNSYAVFCLKKKQLHKHKDCARYCDYSSYVGNVYVGVEPQQASTKLD